MIGNDIIDLSLAQRQSNWRRPRFLEKLFSSNEREQILESPKKAIMVWLYWSMKESAYKAWQRKTNAAPVYNPGDFESRLHFLSSKRASGIVSKGCDVYFSESIITKDYLHTIAGSFAGEKTFRKVLSSEENLTDSFLSHFCHYAAISPQETAVRKNSLSIPQIFLQNTETSHSFSLSHHGRFSAFAYSLNNS